jgi:hypothetical protein
MGRIESLAPQQSVYRLRHSRAIAVLLFRELALNGVEQVSIEDRWMLARADLTLEDDFADVEPLAQEVGEGPSCDGDPANGPPIREVADFGDDSALPLVG